MLSRHTRSRPEFTPTVVGDKVYTPGDSFQFHALGFHALDASTGEVVWSFETGIGGEAPPTVVGGVVYLTAVNAAYALDESTGELLWSYDTERLPAREFPAVIADEVYYFAPDNYVYALDVATGEPLWSYEFSAADGMVDGTPVVADGVVYVGLEFGSFHALQAGSVLWSRESGDVRLDSPVVADGVLYAESSDGFLRALNAATGEELWTFQKGYFSGVRSFTVTDNVVYVGALDGGMHAFPAPKVEEVLTLLYWQAPSLPGPYLSGGLKDRDAGAVTLEPLAIYNPDGDLLPALAVEIPTIENGGISQDLMSITWRLKKGLRWSDGSDVTADDVVFTWRYCVDEETGCTAVDAFNGIASVEALDARTVKITFDAPTPYPYSAFVSAGTPIISQAQFADCVGAAASSCVAENTAPLGTGPYRIVSFEIDKEAVYKRNPFYRGSSALLRPGGSQWRRGRSLSGSRRSGDGRGRLRLESAGDAGDACRNGGRRTGHRGVRVRQPGGACRRQSDGPGPCAGREPLRVPGRAEPASVPGLHAYSPGHVDGHRSRPHNRAALWVRRRTDVQSDRWSSQLRLDRQRRVPLAGHRGGQPAVGRERRPRYQRRRRSRIQRYAAAYHLSDHGECRPGGYTGSDPRLVA